MENIQHKLSALDKKSETLIQEGKYLESLDVLEEALQIRKEFFGDTSDEYYKTAEKLCELCNMLSMIFLQKEKFDATLDFLKKAELLSQNSFELRAVTYNNMACYYRRIGKLRIALKYLEDAIAIETRLDKTKTLADSHLNICAVHSQLGKHDVAMTHIMKSIILLQDEILGYSMPSIQDNTRMSSKIQKDPDAKKQFEDRVAVLAIAYHNLGVEHEYLKQYEEAVSTYRKAVNFATTHLGEQSQVVKNLQSVLENASNQIEINKNKSLEKKTSRNSNTGKSTPTSNLGSHYKQASSNFSSKSGTRTETKGLGYALNSTYKIDNYGTKDAHGKISGELVSASSGFTPKLYEPTSKRNDAKNKNYSIDESQGQESSGHNKGNRGIEDSMKEETFNDESKTESKGGVNASDQY